MKKALFLLCCALVLVSVSACGGSSKKEVRPAEEFNPDQAFDRANKMIEKKEYDEARALLLEIKNRDLTKKYGPAAQLRIADTYVKDGEPELAVAEYQRFLDIYPDHQHAPYAQYQIAMVYFNQIEGPDRGYGGAERALFEFEKLKRDFPRNPYKDVIDIRIEKCKNTIAEYEYLVGEFYLKKGSYAAAIGRFEGVLHKFPEFYKSDRLYFSLARAYRKSADPDKAEALLNRLIEKFPSSPLVKDAAKELSSLRKDVKK
ncbi:MAG: outer membrane protein assembly factor BamD [Thermodesulfovibrionales bacterium]